MLAEKYYYGKGVPADRRLAKEWYEASAKMGHVSAQYMYGYILCASARGEEDLKTGIKYVKKRQDVFTPRRCCCSRETTFTA